MKKETSIFTHIFFKAWGGGEAKGLRMSFFGWLFVGHLVESEEKED